MPGLVGFVGTNGYSSSKQLITNLARALEPSGPYVSELYHAEGIGLGRIRLDIAGSNSHPIWYEDLSCAIVVEGEIYEAQILADSINAVPCIKDPDNIHELVLALYHRYGLDFAKHLTGNFSIAIWDARERNLLLVSDRLGINPLYYTYQGNCFIFSSGLRAITSEVNVPLSIDKLAVAQFLTFDHTLEERTLIDQVTLLPAGSVLIHQDGKTSIQSYWSLQFPNVPNLLDEANYIEQLSNLLRKAHSYELSSNSIIGVFLSGGLDSRMIIGLLAEMLPPQQLVALTWGTPNSMDWRFAKEVAAKLKVLHKFHPSSPERIREYAPEVVWRANGLSNIIHAHAMSSIEEESNQVSIIYKGFLSSILGWYQEDPRLLANYEVEDFVRLFFNIYQQVFKPREHSKYLTNDFRNLVAEDLQNSLLRTLSKCNSSIGSDRMYHFNLSQRQRRFTLHGVNLVKSRMKVRMPYYDRNLMDFIITIPAGLRHGKYLMKKVFVQLFPKLAKIPLTGMDYPLIVSSRDIKIRSEDILRWHLHRIGFAQTPYRIHQPKIDYDHWFRTSQRTWLEDILLSKRTLERGYFQPDAIRRLVTEHMNGANHSLRLSSLISLELAHRQFLDR